MSIIELKATYYIPLTHGWTPVLPRLDIATQIWYYEILLSDQVYHYQAILLSTELGIEMW